MSQLRTALGFLTPLPVGTAVPDAGTATWFPFVGAGLGGVVALVWWGAGEAFPPVVAAALVVAADLLLTGALHLDGLADSADGLLAHKGVDRDRRAAIMRAPDVGAFGVAAVVTVLLLRLATVASMDVDGWMVASLWAGSRGAMTMALATVPYVGGGLGAAFVGPPGKRSAFFVFCGLLPMLLALQADDAGVAVLALVVAWVAGVGVIALGRRRLGGVTGDVLGATGLVVETVGLIVASARW